jgi:hypothetical protein
MIAFVSIGITLIDSMLHDPRAALTTGCVQWRKCLVENMVFSLGTGFAMIILGNLKAFYTTKI